MFLKKFIVKIYKLISNFYIFIFGRKSMQFYNDIILSLSLNAKGYKNYGDFNKTGEKAFIKLINKEIKFSIDVGANIGNYTKLLLLETDSTIFSFEPLPKAFGKLKTIKEKFSDRLKIFNIALGDKNTNLEINYGDETSEKASFLKNLEGLSFVGDYNKHSMLIEVKKLDDYEEILPVKNIDLIKIDTEGYEYEVLVGAQKILSKYKPKFIQIEFNWHQMIKKQTLYSFSKLIPFSDVFQILPNGNKLIEVDPMRPESNIYHLSNFVFIRKDISKRFK